MLAAPLGLLSGLAIAHAPRAPVQSRVHLADTRLSEGQSTRLLVEVDAGPGVEQATVTMAGRPPTSSYNLPPGRVSASVSGRSDLELVLSARRWGVRPVGTAVLTASSPWGGYRWHSGPLPERTLTVLPQTSTFTSVESPNPLGLVGQNPVAPGRARLGVLGDPPVPARRPPPPGRLAHDAAHP